MASNTGLVGVDSGLGGGLVGGGPATPPATSEQLAEMRRNLVEMFGGEGKKYTVVEGDNLHHILLREFGKLDKVRTPTEREARWMIGLMIHLNPQLADNPHLIKAGQTLQLPKAHQMGVALLRAQKEDLPPGFEAAMAGGMFGMVGGFLREAISQAEKDGADPAKVQRARAAFDSFNTMKPQHEKFAGQLSPNRVVDRGAGLEPQAHGSTFGIRNIR